VKSQTTEFGKFGKLPKKTVHKLVLDWYSRSVVGVWRGVPQNATKCSTKSHKTPQNATKR
jgi:hypothetical protein